MAENTDTTQVPGIFMCKSSSFGDLLEAVKIDEIKNFPDNTVTENTLLQIIDDAKKMGMPFPNFVKMLRDKNIKCKWDSDEVRCIIYADGPTNPDHLHQFANGLVIHKNDYSIIVPCQRQFVEIENLPETIGANRNEIPTNDACRHIGDYTIQKLYDASSIRLYYYNGSWQVCLRRCVDGTRSWWDPRKTFHQMYRDCKIDESTLDRNLVYFCSLCHPYNYVLDPKRPAKLILNDAVDVRSGAHIDINTISVPMDKVEILTAPEENIGCVLVDKNNVRYIWRDPVYAKRCKMIGNWQDRRYQVLNMIREKRIDEFLQMFPEFAQVHETIVQLINKFCKSQPENYQKLMNEPVENIAKLIGLVTKKSPHPRSVTIPPKNTHRNSPSAPTLDSMVERTLNRHSETTDRFHHPTERVKLMDAVNRRPLPKINGRPGQKNYLNRGTTF